MVTFHVHQMTHQMTHQAQARNREENTAVIEGEELGL